MIVAFFATLATALYSERHHQEQREAALRRLWGAYFRGVRENELLSEEERHRLLVEADLLLEQGHLPPSGEVKPLYVRRTLRINIYRDRSGNAKSLYLSLASRAMTYGDEQAIEALREDASSMRDDAVRWVESRLSDAGAKFRRSESEDVGSSMVLHTVHYEFMPRLEAWIDERGYAVTGVREAWPKVEPSQFMGIEDELLELLRASKAPLREY